MSKLSNPSTKKDVLWALILEAPEAHVQCWSVSAKSAALSSMHESLGNLKIQIFKVFVFRNKTMFVLISNCKQDIVAKASYLANYGNQTYMVKTKHVTVCIPSCSPSAAIWRTICDNVVSFLGKIKQVVQRLDRKGHICRRESTLFQLVSLRKTWGNRHRISSANQLTLWQVMYNWVIKWVLALQFDNISKLCLNIFVARKSNINIFRGFYKCLPLSKGKSDLAFWW